MTVRLGGPFVGARNHGRVYLPVYPPKIDDADAFGTMLAAAGRAASGFYGIGLWHLTDSLDAAEADDLAALIDEYWGAPLLTLGGMRLALLRVHDDLALGSACWTPIEPARV